MRISSELLRQVTIVNCNFCEFNIKIFLNFSANWTKFAENSNSQNSTSIIKHKFLKSIMIINELFIQNSIYI